MCVLLEKFTPVRVLQKILIGIRNMFNISCICPKDELQKVGV